MKNMICNGYRSSVLSTRRSFYRFCSTALLPLLATGAMAQAPYIPPDLFGDAHQGTTMLRKNAGQVLDTQGDPRPDVRFKMESTPVDIWLREKSVITYSLAAMHRDSVTPDTVYRVDLELSKSNQVDPVGIVNAQGSANYYRGKDAFEDVQAYYRGIYQEVEDDIDVHVYGSKGGPRMAFVVRPGGDPSDIKLSFTGQDSLGIDWEGSLKVYLKDKWVTLREAFAFQVGPGASMIPLNWTAGYTHEEEEAFAHFTFGTYNPELPLVLQIGFPSLGGGAQDLRNLTWSTYAGGTGGDELTCVELDKDSHPYACGVTWSSDFPVQTGYEHFPPFQELSYGWSSAVAMKFNKNNKRLEWATYFGGSTAYQSPAWNSGKTGAHKLALYTGPNENQYVFVTGTTNTEDFDPYKESGSIFQNATTEEYDGGTRRMWVAAFRQYNGQRFWATTHGESGSATWSEDGLAITVGDDGTLAVGGKLHSYNGPVLDFPHVTPSGAFSRSSGGAFFIVFNSDYTIGWSTPFAESDMYTKITDMRIDQSVQFPSQKRLWFTGHSSGIDDDLDLVPPPVGGFFQAENGDVMLACVELATRQLDYCTRWGATVGTNGDVGGMSVAFGLDIIGNQVWVVGYTQSDAMTLVQCPFTNIAGAHWTDQIQPSSGWGQWSDGFILRFNRTSYALEYGTLIGGNKDDILLDIGHDANSVYITGETRSFSGFSTDLDPSWYFQPQYGSSANKRDAILLAVGIGSPVVKWRSAFGGTRSDRGWGIAASATEVYLVGATESQDNELFPLKEFDINSPFDFYQEVNWGGYDDPIMEWYEFSLAMDFEHTGFGETPPEMPQPQPHDGFIASFTKPLSTGIITPRNKPDHTLVVRANSDGTEWLVLLPHEGDWEIELFDASGRLLEVHRSKTTTRRLDLAARASGIYLIRATSGTGEYRAAKVQRP